ncbi:MAG: hypothetical protein ACHQJ4_03690 [Ignavibacteria bacterium]
MAIPQNKTEFIDSLAEFSQDKIKNMEDIGSLFESYISDRETFYDLIFTAKYLNGLGRILQKGFANIAPDKLTTENEQDSQRKIRGEYKTQLEKFIRIFNELAEKLPQDEQERFNEKYFKLDRSSMVNVTTLIYDLCWVKKYINSEK